MAFWKIKSGLVVGQRGVLDYIGEIGHLFYSQDDNVIRISDGHTLGGIPLSGGSLTFSGDTPPTNPSEGNLWWNTVDGRLYIYYDNNWVDASPDIVNTSTGGIALTDLSVGTPNSASGSGAISYNSGTGVFKYTPPDLSAYLTSTNLTTYATTTYVTNAIEAASHPAWSINSGTTSVTVANDGSITMSANSLLTAFESDFNIQVANTSNSINIFGEFHVHAPAVLGITPEPIFRVLQDGQVRMLVPKQDLYEAGVGIIGSTASNFLPPVNLGVMLHITGQQDQPSRIYNDAANTFAAYVGRRYNGSTTSPSPVAKNDILMRISAVGYAPSGMPNFGSSRIAFVATEDHTDANQGGELQFWTNATGTTFLAKDITISSHGITFRDGTSQDTAAIPMGYMGTANGVATLDSGGKVPASQLAAGAVIYKGAWDASTNLTAIGGYALSDTTPTGLQSGWQYSVSVTGTRDIGNGSDTFTTGDYVTYNGTHWDRIPGSASGVVSFNGRAGSVSMTTTDVTTVLTPGSIPTNRLATNSYTFNQGAGITVSNNGVPVALGGTVTISNAGVTSLASLSSNITVSANTGSINLNWVNNSGYLTSATVNNYFNTSTLVSNAVTATYASIATTATSAAVAYSVAGGYVASISANNGVSVSTSTGAVVVSGVVATTSTYGVIKVGAGLSIDNTGTVSTTQIENIRDAGAITALTVDYSTDGIIICSTTGDLTINHQNFRAGKVVRVIISQPAKRNITHGVSAANSNIGNILLASNIQTNVPNSVFIQFTSVDGSLAQTYAQIVY